MNEVYVECKLLIERSRLGITVGQNFIFIGAGVSTVGEYCRSLAELHVTDCRDVTEQSLTRLRQRGVRVDRQLAPVLLRLLRIRNEQRHARLQI